MPWVYVLIAMVFAYTTIANMIERPDGLKIASWFILAIVISSFSSRMQAKYRAAFQGFRIRRCRIAVSLGYASSSSAFPCWCRIGRARRDLGDKEADIRRRHRLADDVPIVFVEAEVGDPSEFQQSPLMQIKAEGERFIIRVERCVSVAHVLAGAGLGIVAGRPAAGDSFRLVG